LEGDLDQSKDDVAELPVIPQPAVAQHVNPPPQHVVTITDAQGLLSAGLSLSRSVLQIFFYTTEFGINNLPSGVLQVVTAFKPLVGPNKTNHHGAWYRFHLSDGVRSIISIIHASKLGGSVKKNSIIFVSQSALARISSLISILSLSLPTLIGFISLLL
jgi:hypothetical protein